MTRVLGRRLSRIRRFVDSSKEDNRYSALFSSKHGKKLGRQLKDLMNFVTAMSFMNLPVTLFQREWVRIWQEGEFDELKKHSKTATGFEDMELMLRVMTLISDQGEVDLSNVFSRKDMRRLLALLTLSSSAYLDSYLDSIVSTLSESGILRELVEQYIAVSKIENRRDSSKVTEFKHIRRLGSNQLVEILYESFNIEETCKTHFTGEEVQRYRKLMTFFIRLRGKIAHGDPEPSLKRFDHDFFIEIKDILKKSILEQWENEIVPVPLLNMASIIQKWFKKNLSIMSVIFAIPLLIILPICLLDAAIDFYS